MIHYITTNGIGNTWVANELLQVQRAEISFVLHAMRKPDETCHRSSWAVEIPAATQPIYPLPRLGVVVSTLAAPFLFLGWFFSALGNAMFAPRETLRGRVSSMAHLFVACHWARRHRRGSVAQIHAQWIHSSGTIAMYAAWLLDVPFSFTGHAMDLFRDRVAIKDKIRRAETIVCVSTCRRDFYREHGAHPQQLTIVYCGIDVGHYSPPDQTKQATKHDVSQIRSSGCLVDKKGFEYLIDPCKVLAQRGVDFECIIGGSGPLEQALRFRIDNLEIQDQVSMTGCAHKQEDIREFMHTGSLYCMPCIWASDNDVDGLPQMLMEAMACGLPAISTRLVGIPILIIHEEPDLVVEPNQSEPLADAIVRLGRDPQLSARLAEAGRQYVIKKLDLTNCLEPLIDAFRRTLIGPKQPPNSQTRSPDPAFMKEQA